MSEYDDPRERKKADQGQDVTPEASVHITKWSPWVWIVPALAILFVGWLVVRYGFFGGGDITVRFADARGLERYSAVKFRGAKVGTVQKITIDKDLKQVVVRISMDASMNHALRTGTKFWIEEPGLEGGGVGGLLSGTSVGIAPGEGKEVREFLGQEYPPVLPASEEGTNYVLEANGLGSLAAGSPVQFNGLHVGRVLGAEYDEKRGLTSIHVFVVKRFAGHVREGTRFWRAGGLSFGFAGGGVKMTGASLASLLSAPVAFYTPEYLAGPPAGEGTHFELFESETAAQAAADGSQLTYLTYFPGPMHGLSAGTPVTMKGLEVGRVREVRLQYVPESATLVSPVLFEIDPRQLEFPIDASTTRVELRERMNNALQKLVQKGMRATLSTSLVLPGASAVALEMVGSPGSGRLVLTSDPPVIPAATSGSGLEGAMSSINRVASTIENLPLQEIAGNLRSASQRMNSLVHDPILDESLRHLNASLTDLEKTAATARENVGPIAKNLRDASASAESAARTANSAMSKVSENVDPIVKSLRSAADSAQAAAGRAEQLMGSSARQNYDLGQLIKELTRAAEAVRALASYIAENPDALLKGRK